MTWTRPGPTRGADSHAALDSRECAALLSCSLFGSLSPQAQQDLVSCLEWREFASGETLFKQGDAGDSLYILLYGRLRAYREENPYPPLGDMRRGETVGEIAVVSGETRSATVVAVRDSVLARLSRDAFERFVDRHPRALLQISRVLVNRLRHAESRRAERIGTIAVLPAHPGPHAADFCRGLARSLAAVGPSLHLSREFFRKNGRETQADAPRNSSMGCELSHWLDEQEDCQQVLVYEADPNSSAWTERCLRQADRILVVAENTADPAPGKVERELLGRPGANVPQFIQLVLLHPPRLPPHATGRWLAPREGIAHHHLDVTRGSEYDRLARLVTGTAYGLALGGGGARGFAHIGVLRALEEAGIPIDLIGGTSMGAVIAAQHAMGMSPEEMLSSNRRAWIEGNPLGDRTLPILSLVAGRNVERMLQDLFGERSIEDLPLPYFCVSSNLSTAEPVVHRAGLLRRWVRASIAVPGIAVPVLERGELLVDGGVLNNLPCDIVRQLGCNTVLAVDVTADRDLCVPEECESPPPALRLLLQRIGFSGAEEMFPSILDVLMRTTMLGSMRNSRLSRGEADLCLHPPVGGWRIFDWRALDAIVDSAYEYAVQRISEWTKSRSSSASSRAESP